MAQTYTLEEAASKLNVPVDEFKRRLRTEWTQVRSFRDGNTLRFRANEIDELARSIGASGSEELQLSDSSEFNIPIDAINKEKAKSSKKPESDAPLKLDSDEVFLLSDEPANKKFGDSDSDIRLQRSGKMPKPNMEDDESIIAADLDAGKTGSGKLTGKSGRLSSVRMKGGDSKVHTDDSSGIIEQGSKPDSSEFELTLDMDSSEFEFTLQPDSSEEAAIGEVPAADKKKSGQSGINLNKPSDSGVSLEKKKQKPKSDDEIDFELSLDAPGSGLSSKKNLGGKAQADSDSEFELTLEEPSDLAADKKGDIFEATDFELPALEDDSASEAVSLDEADTDLESSDFDLAIEDADASSEDISASEVVAIDEDELAERSKNAKAKPKAKAKANRLASDDDDGEAVDIGIDEAPRAKRRAADEEEEEEEYEVSAAAEDDAVAAPAEWGTLPLILLCLTLPLVFLGGLMAYELLHTLWGYQQGSTPATPIISMFAKT